MVVYRLKSLNEGESKRIFNIRMDDLEAKEESHVNENLILPRHQIEFQNF